MAYVLRKDEDARWRWFKVVLDGTDTGAEVELKLPTLPEIQAVFEMAGDNIGKTNDYAAEHWFRDFRGVVDPDGQPVEPTLENRRALLNEPDIGIWLRTKINDFRTWREEGKADSASA
jgi:hypothetical protein